MERFVSQSPDPALRIGRDGRVIYSNRAGELFLHEWSITVGEKVPLSIGNFVKRVISLSNPEKTEIKVGKKIYLISFHPLEREEQVNVYGFDITNHKKLEESFGLKSDRTMPSIKWGGWLSGAKTCRLSWTKVQSWLQGLLILNIVKFWNVYLTETSCSGQEQAGSQAL